MSDHHPHHPESTPMDGSSGTVSALPGGALDGPTLANLPDSQQQVNSMVAAFWEEQVKIMNEGKHDFKFHQLPLARIKKVMKSDENLKNMMISAEAPLIFSKACEIFILELTMRTWIHAEENKRRTVQKSDVASAVSKADVYDFLIDIVPREEATKPSTSKEPGMSQFANYYPPNAPAYGVPMGAAEQQHMLLSGFPGNPQFPRQMYSNDDHGPGGVGVGSSHDNAQQFYLQQYQQLPGADHTKAHHHPAQYGRGLHPSQHMAPQHHPGGYPTGDGNPPDSKV
ncbi:histone-fold-containing protein [Polychytrium aggregatum]|uniref:histone-fold-containing protein n=1 Tax=Polychytrium aggregatum TaxID=110093 RepID=UPI0022FE42E3|nr:histone-fold-containing protein [Polychytrium aggregatum]KAI9207779.1 histone-fold-containing protein [Polychytrium aggregatum]